MKKVLIFDSRKLKEIQHCVYYKNQLAHGTVGHNLLMLAAEVFEALEFGLDENNLLTFQGIRVSGNDTLTAEFDIKIDGDWRLTG